MGLLDWLTRREKSLLDMSRTELRRQEILLNREREQLAKRISRLGEQKQALFERGRQERSPEVRRLLAQEFEMKTSEQVLLGRQLNLRSKELLTVMRVRMLRENADRRAGQGARARLSPRDLARLARLIESDAVSAEAYRERLDALLEGTGEIDEAVVGGLSPAGEKVLAIWEEMDRGLIEDVQEAFERAERDVRSEQAPAGEA